MPSRPTSAQLYTILDSLDWRGHVELPPQDMLWIAEQLAGRLAGKKDRHLCEACEEFKEIVIHVGKAGRICEDCLTNGSEQAEETRSLLEG